MSRIGKLTRRAFMVSSIAVVGGVAFGGYYLSRPAPNPLKGKPDKSVLNPFVFIDQNGVTLIAPRAEMGQGIRPSLAALIADELDVNLEDVNVIHGPAAQAYYNAALMSGLPSYDDTKNPGAFTKAMLGTMSKLMGLQITGGSTSMVDGFERMRKAGASARETLKEAVAQKLGIPRNLLKTENAMIIAPDGQEYSYRDVALEAANIDVINDVELRDKSSWRYIGKAVPRVDIVEKVTGAAQYSIDIRLPGMRFAALRMNPKRGGQMISYDAAVASQMTGVEKVVNMGQGVAVVATNTWLAQKAVDAVEIAWGKAPYPENTSEIFKTIEQAFEQEPNSALRDRGDLENIPAELELHSAEYRVPYLAHVTMEPMNAAALFKDGQLTLWIGTQGPLVDRYNCAVETGLDPENIEVITTYMGGGFGRRGEVDFSIYAARLAMHLDGVPFQLTWSRDEDIKHDFYRPGAIARFKGAVQNGKAVLMDGQIASQSADFQFMARIGGPVGEVDKVMVDGLVDQPYDIPNYRMRGYLADFPLPVGFWRSVGYSVNGFMHDTFIDELAHKANADPLDFRYQMIKDVDQASANVLKKVGEMSGWSKKRPQGVGMGLGFSYSFGTPVAIVMRVAQQNGEIQITNAWIACDIGLAVDPEIVRSQMVGGMIYGLSAACYEEVTFAKGEVEQSNIPDYNMLRMKMMPKTEVAILENKAHMGGAGEPSTPPAMPAIGNALFNLTGIRARSLPLVKEYSLVI